MGSLRESGGMGEVGADGEVGGQSLRGGRLQGRGGDVKRQPKDSSCALASSSRRGRSGAPTVGRPLR